MASQQHVVSPTQMVFIRGEDAFLDVETGGSGEVAVSVGSENAGRIETYTLTLGQSIQLRDFLNRHLDELALKQVGSLAVRSSDDPTQLASVEEIPPSEEQHY